MAKAKTQKQQATYNRARNSELMAAMVAPPPPAAPAPVTPLPTANDMLAVNDWLTNYATQLEDIDFGVGQLELDTGQQKAANDRQALESRSAADDAMAARGIFGSSLRDAATYDIEATRALANTFLDTKLQTAITQGTTRKGTLGQAKLAFETGMRAKYAENAAAVNGPANEAYATALASYKPPVVRPKLAAPTVSAATPTVTASRPQRTTAAKPGPAAATKPPKPPKPKKPKP